MLHLFPRLQFSPVNSGEWYSVYELTDLALRVSFNLPAPWQFQLHVGKLVEKNHQVPVMLVALKVPGVTAYFQDHVFDTTAAGKHPVGCLEKY